MRRISFIIILVAVFFAGSNLIAQEYEYIGAMKCKMCHNKSTTGEQYNKWLAGPHAKAMEALKSDKAKEIAKAKGIADPSTDAKCVKCHATTGYTDKKLQLTIKEEEGVSCESCHGPGSVYKSMSIMKDPAKAMANGMIKPEEKVCKQCHNEESPTYKEFNYAEYSKKIAHPNPAKK